MTVHPHQQIEADRVMRSAGIDTPASASETVKVWDVLVRIFHWSLVALFATAFITGEHSETIHIRAGYGVLALVGVRILWGFVGTRHARFTDFVYRPATVLGYMRDAALFRARRYLGHNPAGGAMVLALLASLVVTGASGVTMTLDSFWGQKWIEEIHEAAAHATLILIGLHVAGVVFSSLSHGENLVRSMITGRKRT